MIVTIYRLKWSIVCENSHSVIPNDRELLSKSKNLCYKLASGGCRMLIFGALEPGRLFPSYFWLLGAFI